MSLVLADTSGLYALLNRRDPFHTMARRYYQSLPRHSEVIVIEYVLVETMTLLRARGFSPLAVQFRDALDKSVVFSLHHSTPELEIATYDVFRRYHDKEWSYVDCAILATSKAIDVSAVLSLDHHIDQMGLQRLPTQQ